MERLLLQRGWMKPSPSAAASVDETTMTMAAGDKTNVGAVGLEAVEGVATEIGDEMMIETPATSTRVERADPAG